MLKALIIGLLSGLAAVSGARAVAHWRLRAEAPVSAAAAPFETRKTKEINVPKIRAGAVKGYVVAQFSYALKPPAAGAPALSPDSFVVDEAFKYLYDDESIDFAHLDKFDLHAMTAALVANVNARLKSDAIADIGVQEFTFMPATDSKPRAP